MPWPRFTARPARVASILTLTLALVGCGDRTPQAQAEKRSAADERAAESRDGESPDGEVAAPKVDPCGLLNDDELSAQLWLTVPPSQRESYKAKGFEVTKTEVPWGISRRCELSYRSKQLIGDSPATRGEFNVMVSHAGAVPIADRQKKPIPGVGDEAYRHQQTWYVRVGDLVASLTDFDATNEPGLEPDAGRIALLTQIAQRLR